MPYAVGWNGRNIDNVNMNSNQIVWSTRSDSGPRHAPFFCQDAVELIRSLVDAGMLGDDRAAGASRRGSDRKRSWSENARRQPALFGWTLALQRAHDFDLPTVDMDHGCLLDPGRGIWGRQAGQTLRARSRLCRSRVSLRNTHLCTHLCTQCTPLYRSKIAF